MTHLTWMLYERPLDQLLTQEIPAFLIFCCLNIRFALAICSNLATRLWRASNWLKAVWLSKNFCIYPLWHYKWGTSMLTEFRIQNKDYISPLAFVGVLSFEARSWPAAMLKSEIWPGLQYIYFPRCSELEVADVLFCYSPGFFAHPISSYRSTTWDRESLYTRCFESILLT